MTAQNGSSLFLVEEVVYRSRGDSSPDPMGEFGETVQHQTQLKKTLRTNADSKPPARSVGG